MKAKEKENCEMVCIGVRITKAMHQELAKQAEERDLTMSQIVRIAIKNFILSA